MPTGTPGAVSNRHRELKVFKIGRGHLHKQRTHVFLSRVTSPFHLSLCRKKPAKRDISGIVYYRFHRGTAVTVSTRLSQPRCGDRPAGWDYNDLLVETEQLVDMFEFLFDLFFEQLRLRFV